MLLSFTASIAIFAAPTPLVPPPAAKSVYKIVIETQPDHQVIGSGTGWIAINKEGQIRVVTNSHVCVVPHEQVYSETNTKLQLRLEDGRPLKQYIFDPFADICILSIEGDTSNEIALKLSKEPTRPGEPIYVIGHPLGGPLKLVTGNRIDETLMPTAFYDIDEIISYGEQNSCLPVPSANSCLYIRTSDTYKVEIYPGNSGSPILNIDGAVVGEIWGYQPGSGKALAVSHEQLKRYIQ